MNEPYLAALWQEISAWKQVEVALTDQRQAVLARDANQLWGLQDRLQELLRQASLSRNESLGHRRQVTGGAALPPDVTEIEQQAHQMHLRVHDAIRLNHELLKDICTYLEMIREVVFPHTLPPTYGHPSRQQRVPADHPAATERVA